MIKRLLFKRLGLKLYWKYRKCIYSNLQFKNQLTGLFLLWNKKSYLFDIKLIKNYYLKCHSLSWNAEDLHKRLIIGIYEYKKSYNNQYNWINIFYFKNGGVV